MDIEKSLSCPLSGGEGMRVTLSSNCYLCSTLQMWSDGFPQFLGEMGYFWKGTFAVNQGFEVLTAV